MWCSGPWCILILQHCTSYPGFIIHPCKRGGIEKQSLFLLEPGSQSFIVSWDRAAPPHALHLHVQSQILLETKVWLCVIVWGTSVVVTWNKNIENMTVKNLQWEPNIVCHIWYSSSFVLKFCTVVLCFLLKCLTFGFLSSMLKSEGFAFHFISCIFLIMSLSGSAQRYHLSLVRFSLSEWCSSGLS